MKKKGTDTSANLAADTMTDVFDKWMQASVGAADSDAARKLREYNVELVRFATERFQEEMKTRMELMFCWHPVCMREIQGRYLKTALNQYSAEAGRMVRMNRALFDELTNRQPAS